MATKEVWKALLEQHDKLKKAASATLFDRVTLLARVYEDPHYLADIRKNGKSPTEALDSRVSDTCANFTELLQMLRLFPKRGQWETGDLNGMRIKMLDEMRKKQQEMKAKESKSKNGRKKKHPEYRDRATLAEVAEMRQVIEKKKTEVDHLREQLIEKEKRIAGLEESIEQAKITISSLQETVALLRIEKERLQNA